MATLARKSTRPVVLGRNSNGTLMTPREFDAVEEYDENFRYELINGVIIVIRIPDATEAGPNELLAYYLLTRLRLRPTRCKQEGSGRADERGMMEASPF